MRGFASPFPSFGRPRFLRICLPIRGLRNPRCMTRINVIH
jgi:hypothetical protein